MTLSKKAQAEKASAKTVETKATPNENAGATGPEGNPGIAGKSDAEILAKQQAAEDLEKAEKAKAEALQAEIDAEKAAKEAKKAAKADENAKKSKKTDGVNQKTASIIPPLPQMTAREGMSQLHAEVLKEMDALILTLKKTEQYAVANKRPYVHIYSTRQRIASMALQYKINSKQN